MDLASPQHPAGERQWVLGCRSMQVSGAGDEGQRPSTEPGVGKGGVPLFSPSFGSFSWRRKKRTNIPRGPGPQLRGNPPAGGTAGAQHPQGVRRIRKAAEPPTAAQKGTKDTLRRGDFDFPPPKNHPLETTKHKGGCGPPYWMYPPGERADEDSAARRPPFGAQPPLAAALSAEIGPYGELSVPHQARRARWTLPSCDTRPWNGSGCWGARVCRFPAPSLNSRHSRQTRGIAKGCSPLPAFFWVLFLAEQEKYEHSISLKLPDLLENIPRGNAALPRHSLQTLTFPPFCI